MSNIEWTDTTWQVTSGCTKVSAGCAQCYAETMATRLAGMARADVAAGRDPGRKKSYPLVVRNNGLWNGEVVTLPDNLADPLTWRKPKMVFVNSMSDLFHEAVPFEFIRRVFAVMSMAGQHTFQVLTKRPERMAAFFADEENSLSACQAEFTVKHETPMTPSGRWSRIRDTRSINGTRRGVGDGNYWPLPNVWLGASAEDQDRLDERVPHLLKCPAAVRFLSCEPLLGPLDLHGAFYRPRRGPGDTYKRHSKRGVDWVIVGGESGHGARPCDVGWIRGVVRQCAEAGVPCFVKQLGASVSGQIVHPDNEGYGVNRVRLIDRKGGDPSEWPEDLRVRQFPEVRK